MIDFLKRNYQFLFVLVAWMTIGVYIPALDYVLIPLFLVLFARRGMYAEVFIGFWFVLILSDNLHSSMDFAENIKPVLMVLMAVIFFINRRAFLPLSNLYKSFLPFYLVALIALFFSPVPETGIQKTISHFLLFLSVPQFAAKGYESRGGLFFKDMLFLGITLIIGSFLYGFINPDFVYLLSSRFKGIFGNPNGLGAFLLMMLMLFEISRRLFPEMYSKGETRLVFLVIIIAALMAGSRTTLTSLTLFIVLSRFFLRSPITGLIMFAVIIFVSELIANNLSDIIRTLGLSDFFRVETLKGASGRFIAWRFAYKHVWDAFWMGRGFAFDEHLMIENRQLLNSLGHQGGVHNTYLSYWLNAGIIGVFLFFGGMINRISKANKFNRMAIPFLLVIMFDTFFESWLMASLNPFTIIFLVNLTLLSEPRLYEQALAKS